MTEETIWFLQRIALSVLTIGMRTVVGHGDDLLLNLSTTVLLIDERITSPHYHGRSFSCHSNTLENSSTRLIRSGAM
jgi:hypothetical protein